MEVTAGALEAVMLLSSVLVRFASGEAGRDGGSRVAGIDSVGGVVSLVMAGLSKRTKEVFEEVVKVVEQNCLLINENCGVSTLIEVLVPCARFTAGTRSPPWWDALLKRSMQLVYCTV